MDAIYLGLQRQAQLEVTRVIRAGRELNSVGYAKFSLAVNGYADLEHNLREFTMPPRRNKYNVGSKSERQDKQGVVHDSIRERKRWGELQLMERSGVISALDRQVPFELEVNGIHITTYVADFVYVEKQKLVVEDCKGVRTPVYRLKKQLMLAVHGIEIWET